MNRSTLFVRWHHYLIKYVFFRHAWVVLRRVIPKPLRLLLLGRPSSSAPIDSYNFASVVPAPNLVDWERLRKQTTHYGRPLRQATSQLPPTNETLTFSIIFPVYQISFDILLEAIQSILEQDYTHWELCLVWGDTSNELGWAQLHTLYSNDPRFNLQRPEMNLGISGNSNLALQAATGEYSVLLDHDDLLAPDALSLLYETIAINPDVDFLYSDKDLIDSTNSLRFNPFLKPRLSPEMMYSANYLTHLNAVRTSLLRQIGGWDSELDGAQDWDIFLKILEVTTNIIHVPAILYHWRVHPVSTSSGLQAKPYAAQAQLQALRSHFARKKKPATVTHHAGAFHIAWPPSDKRIDIVVFNTVNRASITALISVIQRSAPTSSIHTFIGKRNHSQLSDQRLHSDRPVTITYLGAETDSWQGMLDAYFCQETSEGYVVLIDGSALSWSASIVRELTGWLENEQNICWTSGISLSDDNRVIEAGRCVGLDYQSAPLFSGVPKDNFGIFGGAGWYRNARGCSPFAFAARTSELKSAFFASQHISQRFRFSAICSFLAASAGRGLINPFAEVIFTNLPHDTFINDARFYESDPYVNPGFVQIVPFRIML